MKTYAPLWIVLFSTGATLLKTTGERYMVHQSWSLETKDVLMAVGGAVLGYLSFRVKQGSRSKPWYTW